MHVVIISGGRGVPMAYGPFDNDVEADAFAGKIPSVWLPSIAEVEAPESWEAE